jgi:hypothetical protein
MLIKGGANANMVTADGSSALLLAAQGGHAEVVHTLLQGGADPNLTRDDGSTVRPPPPPPPAPAPPRPAPPPSPSARVYPLAAHRSNFVCARKLAQNTHLSLPRLTAPRRAAQALTAALHEDFEDICQMLMRAGADDAV